jgi:hypothetical protein
MRVGRRGVRQRQGGSSGKHRRAARHRHAGKHAAARTEEWLGQVASLRNPLVVRLEWQGGAIIGYAKMAETG